VSLFILAGKYRATLAGCLITHGNDQIEILSDKFVPGLAAGHARVDTMPLQSFDRLWVNKAGRVATRADSMISAGTELVYQRFGHDRAAGIACAKYKNVSHYPQQPAVFSEPDAGTASEGG